MDGHLEPSVTCAPCTRISIKCKALFYWADVACIAGLFGLQKDEVAIPALNYVGIAVALVGLAVYLQVESKPNVIKKNDNRKSFEDYNESLLGKSGTEHTQDQGREVSVESTGLYMPREAEDNSSEDVFGSSWPPLQKRVVGITGAAIAGALFGTSFNPAQYVIDTKYDGDDDGLNYVFPHFCGVLCTSWAYTMVYLTKKHFDKKAPFVNPECILPATLSGIMWGIADIAWFVANGELGFSVSFPMITSGPGFLGALWGIFLFKEISGFKNFATLGVAFVISVSALIMIALAH